MAKSDFYKTLISKYENAKSNIQGTFNHFQEVNDIIRTVKEYSNQIVVGGTSIDDGRLEKIIVTINSGYDNLEKISAECDRKISEYTQLYQQALIDEQNTEPSREEKMVVK